MKGIYIGSTTPRAGKSLLAMSLGVLLQRAGYAVGYMKPLGRILQKVEELPGDADALVVQEVLGQKLPANVVTPMMLPDNLRALAMYSEDSAYQEAICRISDSYKRISEGKDIVLVSGTGPFPSTGRFCEADGITIMQTLGLQTLFVERFDGRFNYDALLYLKDILGANMLGVVLNDVPEGEMLEATKLLVPYLLARGVRVHGIIPQEPKLTSMRVAELARGLSGNIVAGNVNASRMVEGFIIGTMQVDNFMIHLRQSPGCAIIVGGDRADLQLAALHANSPCLILTGNIAPNELVRIKAEDLGVPLVSVREDTYSVARSMSYILRGKKLQDLNQIRMGIDLVENSLDLRSILSSLEQM